MFSLGQCALYDIILRLRGRRFRFRERHREIISIGTETHLYLYNIYAHAILYCITSASHNI